MSKSLYQLSAEYETAFLSLADMDIDEQTLMDTIEGLEGTLMAKMANVGAFIKNLEAEADMINQAIERIREREKALDNKVDRLKDYLKDNMVKAGIKSVTAIDSTFKITLLPPRASLVIDDNDKIPSKYIVGEKVTQTIDTGAIKADLEAGEAIECAHLEFKPGLRFS